MGCTVASRYNAVVGKRLTMRHDYLSEMRKHLKRLMLCVFYVPGNHVEEEKASVTFIEIILRMIKFCDTSLCAYMIGDQSTRFCVIISVN